MSKKLPTDRIILGIDPGTTVTGYGIIHCSGKTMQLITHGIIDLRKIRGEHADKLKRIFERTLSLIEEFHPDELAIEAPFYGKNVQSMLKLGRAQGVSMAAALYRDIPIFEYAPKKVKMAVTGNGNASKPQVAAMLNSILKFQSEEEMMDATDGLAVAVCHFLQMGGGGSKSKTSQSGSKNAGKISKSNYNSWKNFVSENPKRVK